MSNELVTIETVNAVEVFQKGGADKILEDFKAKISSVVLDVSTASGREQIRSLAAKIARSKTALDNMGKELKSEWKARCDGIDSERRKIWDGLEELQKQVRQPLTEFEDKEKNRVAEHEHELLVLANWANLGNLGTWQQAEENLVALDGSYKRDWEEFKSRAESVYIEARGSLIASAHNLKKQEADRLELERLRKEEDARKQKEREEQIAKEAAEAAKREAEEKAAREKAELEARQKAEIERVARETAEREAAAKAEQDRIQREKEEADARAKKAEEDRIASEIKAKADAEAAEKRRLADIEQARKTEEARQQKIRDDEAAAAAAREADKKHKAEIHNEIKDALQAVVEGCGNGEDKIKALVIAFATGKIPHVKIIY